MPTAAPDLDTLDELFVAGTAGPRSDRQQFAGWLAGEQAAGETVVDTLTRTGRLIPAAKRVVEAARACAVEVPAARQLFTPTGLEWLRDHLPEPADGPVRPFDPVPGVWLLDGAADPDEPAGRPHTVGCYRVREALGDTVFAAESVFGGERLAVKLLPTDTPAGAAAAERLFTGAAVARHLGQPGGLPVLAADREFGHAFVVMPLVPGGSVRDRQANGVCPAEATAVCGQAARRLAAVHAAGFAHGNLKAGNLLLGPAGVVLADPALPDDAAEPFSPAARRLQRADLDALQGVYAELLGTDAPAACVGLVGRAYPSADDFADALEGAGRELAAGATAQADSIFALTVDDAGPAGAVPPLGAVLGKCRLTGLLGRGATGVVFRATHQTLGVEVAVKVLSSVGTGHDDLSAQFGAEARLQARLNHPNVVRIWDFEAQSQFPPYLVLEFVDGQNLEEIIKAAGPLPAGRAVGVFTQVVAGLAAAHKQAGLIHRDLKPANILVGADGVVKVADLGLAAILDTDKQAGGKVAGTLAYMPPEQSNGVRATDHRSDIYALGATLYQALVGRPPFDARSPMEMMLKHASVEPVPPHRARPAVPAALSAVVCRMLAKRPDDRFQTYDQLAAALQDPACVATVEPRRGGYLSRLLSR